MDDWFWAFYLRFARNFMHAVPTLLIGFLIAAVFAQMMRRENVQRLFGRGWRAMGQAWLVGMLLPVCGLGVLPVLREMRRQGVSAGAILAFGLTAPLFNPISVIYGLTLANPWVILAFCAGSLVIVGVAGSSWNWLFGQSEVSEAQPRAIAPGFRRMVSVGWYLAREMTGPVMLFVLAGLVGVALLGLFLPFCSLQFSAEAHDPLAPLVMGAVSILAYTSPIQVMVIIAGMFEHGNSAGAAFSHLVLGAGLNLGTIVWLLGAYGWRRGLTWLMLFVAVTIAVAYGLNKPLFPHSVSPAGHTHAFDDYCYPFSASEEEPRRAALTQLHSKIEPYESLFFQAWLGCLVVGIVLRIRPINARVQAWLERAPDVTTGFDPYLPPAILWMASLVGLVAFSVIGCFLYYPHPRQALTELQSANIALTSAAVSGEWDVALHWVGINESWLHKLSIGAALRGIQLTPYQQAKANLLSEKLELLEHAVKRRDAKETRELGLACYQAGARLRRSIPWFAAP